MDMKVYLLISVKELAKVREEDENVSLNMNALMRCQIQVTQKEDEKVMCSVLYLR